MSKIKVHEKALAHLSRGLYRSPASALRELVSNAWDAGATLVRINTNYPSFYSLSVEDNGVGFTKEDFEALMEGGVGNSEKRLDADKTLSFGRPVIGRLGIGLLGIAQICGKFTIISKPAKKEKKGFRARVELYDLLKERLDRDDKDIVKEVEVTGTSLADAEANADNGDQVTIKEVNIGEYFFEEYDPDEYKQGTLILTEDVHPTFALTFQKSLRFEKFKRPPLDWRKSLRIVSAVHSLQELGDYWRLLWELAASCPVPYLDESAVPKGLIAKEQERLQSYNFKLIVDGINIYKPILLRSNRGGYTTTSISDQTLRVYGKDLSFHGYLLVQEGLSLRPDELRGILIRIKNVSIGYYDPSMLDYRFNEGPRSRWVTGEIFVDEGLEDALNIDRDSFNRFHPQFRTIQTYVHQKLREDIFPQTYKKIEERSILREIVREEKRENQLHSTLEIALDVPVRIREQPKARVQNVPTVDLVPTTNGVDIVLPRVGNINTKGPNRQLAAAVLAIYEVAMQQRTREKQRTTFTKLLLELLSQW